MIANCAFKMRSRVALGPSPSASTRLGSSPCHGTLEPCRAPCFVCPMDLVVTYTCM